MTLQSVANSTPTLQQFTFALLQPCGERADLDAVTAPHQLWLILAFLFPDCNGHVLQGSGTSFTSHSKTRFWHVTHITQQMFLELYLSWAEGSNFNISDLAKCNGLFARGGSTPLANNIRFYNRSPCISEAMHWSPCLYKEEESYSLWKMAVGVCQVILVLNFHLSLCGWSALAKTLCDLFAWSAAGKQLCSVCSILQIPYFNC